MVTECQQVTTVRPLRQAALDRPLVVVSQSSHLPVAEVTSRAQHQQVSQSLLRHLIRLSTPIEQVPEMGSREHLASSVTVLSRWVRSSPQRPLEAWPSSFPQFATATASADQHLSSVNLRTDRVQKKSPALLLMRWWTLLLEPMMMGKMSRRDRDTTHNCGETEDQGTMTRNQCAKARPRHVGASG